MSAFIADNTAGLILLILRLGLTVTLYFFLAYAIRTIWQDLRQGGKSADKFVVPQISLSKSGEINPITFKLNQVSIGRSPACDFCLQDETVSATHALLYYRKSQWWVEDNQSSNGSLLNDIPVETPTVLTSGDQLTIGSITILVDFPE
jgi:pSer/pThr/pTyr-binding forkhead associated (FHA) protein